MPGRSGGGSPKTWTPACSSGSGSSRTWSAAAAYPSPTANLRIAVLTGLGEAGRGQASPSPGHRRAVRHPRPRIGPPSAPRRRAVRPSAEASTAQAGGSNIRTSAPQCSASLDADEQRKRAEDRPMRPRATTAATRRASAPVRVIDPAAIGSARGDRVRARHSGSILRGRHGEGCAPEDGRFRGAPTSAPVALTDAPAGGGLPANGFSGAR